MSQGGLGEALGVSFQQVRKYEKGVNRIPASRLEQIAGALDVPVTFFFGGTVKEREVETCCSRTVPSACVCCAPTTRWTKPSRTGSWR